MSRIRLPNRAITALEIIYDTSYKTRANKLEKASEYSFSILVHWNKVEALLKILKYKDKITQEYPDKLTFINRSWKILKRAHQSNQKRYKLLLGDGKKIPGCLWETRDRIAHANYILKKSEYLKFKDAAIWFASTLKTNLPDTYDNACQYFLQIKKQKQT